MSKLLNRRQWITQTGAVGCILSAPMGNPVITTESSPRIDSTPTQNTRASEATPPFRYCLNTSTIRGQKLSLVEEIEIAAKAGYQGIEPWIREIEQYRDQGGSLSDLKKRMEDLGLIVESTIGFAPWIVDDDRKRAAALEQAKREMDLVRQIGGTRIAAPPTGATRQVGLDLSRAAQRYARLLEVGDQIGVTPQLEVWGFSKTLSRLGEAALVAIDSGHPQACLLPDVYHLYKGGNAFTGLRMIHGGTMHVFHVNDYPANPPRATIRDAQRVFCGDGVAPLNDIFRTLADTGFRGALSLELFNPEYWNQDALRVAKTGLRKTQAAVRNALENRKKP